MSEIDTIMRLSPVIPVLVIDDLDSAVATAQALVAGGLKVLEVTLRTPYALDAIKAMGEVDGAVVGAGTVLNPKDLDAAIEAGSKFVVSPGLMDNLGRAASASGMPFLPGVATAGDIMRGLDLGFERFKFFPATAAGGLPALKALAGPFANVRFCPTGGVTLETAGEWLAEPSVLCVGGSWLAKPGMSAAEIEQAARAACTKLGGNVG